MYDDRVVTVEVGVGETAVQPDTNVPVCCCAHVTGRRCSVLHTINDRTPRHMNQPYQRQSLMMTSIECECIRQVRRGDRGGETRTGVELQLYTSTIHVLESAACTSLNDSYSVTDATTSRRRTLRTKSG